MDNQNSRLNFRQYPIANWIIGIIFLALAATHLTDLSLRPESFNFILLILEVAIGHHGRGIGLQAQLQLRDIAAHDGLRGARI